MARQSSPVWKDYRKALIAEAGDACIACKRTKKLEVHHLIYRGPGVRGITEEPGDCAVLCLRCHKVLHNKFGYHMLTEDLKNKQELWIEHRRIRFEKRATPEFQAKRARNQAKRRAKL